MSESTVGKGERISVAGMHVSRLLFDFINDEALPATGLDADQFWSDFAAIVNEFAPLNRELLTTRDRLQQQIDHWHQLHSSENFDPIAYKQFLIKIGYLVPDGPPFSIETTQVDEEISALAGPQLVVPVMNARFALNACNARWGSLYDALYGTDVIDESDGKEKGASYNPIRGAEVIEFGRNFLESYFPLNHGDYFKCQGFRIEEGSLIVDLGQSKATLSDPTQFIGYRGTETNPSAIVFVNHGLHVEIVLDRRCGIGAEDAAGISDIILEAALTTIMDCEDSVAAVDDEDKVLVYRNWLGLMRGTLEERVSKNGHTFVRKMNADREYIAPDGSILRLPGRSLLFVRNVGHLMTSPAVLDQNGLQIPEGIMDGMITSLVAIHDLKGGGAVRNSRTGSVYIVKPKMHGPAEVAFTDRLFSAIERALGLDPCTLKVGIMDEERRTSINLKECIRAVKNRVVFINTGFLDRTGDEIHTSMEAGAFATKADIKKMPWINAYETSNVAAGLQCGLIGKAQIGKGMWAMPDNMQEMMIQKIGQPLAGANTAWVPSPTAAVLHAIHYHEVNVVQVQQQLRQNAHVDIETILNIPLLGKSELSSATIEKELENNAQGILGYVVRWVDQGIGCSKVPDVSNVALMEDRATLRISSQHICNWLHHGICTPQQVERVMKNMALVVDEQNAGDPRYQSMAPNFDCSLAFRAAMDLVLKGREQPNGYTEPLLHAFRLQVKSKQ